MGRLVVVSNRIAPPDDKKASAGGLAVGVLGALKAAGGLWFGWSGEISNDEKPLKRCHGAISRGPPSHLVRRTTMNIIPSSQTPCCGQRFTIVWIW